MPRPPAAARYPVRRHVLLSATHEARLLELARVWSVSPSEMLRRLIDHHWRLEPRPYQPEPDA